MCCGVGQEMMDHYGDVKKLTSSVIRKKRFNRNRRHPSMQIDAVLTSTLRLLKDEKLTNAVLESRCRKRPSSLPSTLKRKKSRWDVRTKEPRAREMDEELENMIGMNKFFQRLKEASNTSVCEGGESSALRTASVGVGDQEERLGPHSSDLQSVASGST